MESKSMENIARSTVLCIGSAFLMFASANLAAAEYKLFINDATACRNAGASGDICVVAVNGTATTTTTTTTTTAPANTNTTGSASGCVVTSWNPCSNATSTPTTTTTSTPTNTAVIVSAPVSTAPAPTSNATLDFGSGGTYATGNTNALTVSPGVTSLPFTTAAGKNYSGQVGIVPTSGRVPEDGSEIRMWISTTKGGAPLAGRGCSTYVGFEGDIRWDQSGTSVSSCQIPYGSNLFVNLGLCISDNSDTTCGATGAKFGAEAAPIYVWGVFSIL
ncbi:MAG: hypothetical protein P8M13_09505 [Luminiphilus sp.]|nr:hypothetical protein [Luminiphilus sp.]